MDSDSDSPFTPGPHSSPERQHMPGGRKSLEGIAVRSFCLGMVLAASSSTTTTTTTTRTSPFWRLPFFFASLAIFHFLEFYTTARYSTADATIKSFLLTANWPAYAIAHSSASLECLLTNLAFPHRASPSSLISLFLTPFLPAALIPSLNAVLLLAGISLVLVGQAIRSAAMAEAGPSFNHVVQHRKRDTHVLVTTGCYAHLRHPSYFGFFWWAVGTQLVLGNVLCLAAYVAVLWHFFSSRVRAEESSLVRFFGRDYVEYQRRVGTKMPFIG
ncbi:isoprenylcysteine carboxyl methyltransferase [Microdochium trichocladiopsis]|uniref:Protein-S-isoprenylcysteine O-methyltransferase n=1 Tax=Microdochium trichocladiopsis TaxID=1682393 RepID=A0A9P8YFS6_9PEZI|nr:isoprenylcysteine carboxyl methyltransferase [Microdochium trichocladiopsis]KAH7038181.1 isoprenylcysteine carboxyl methyltransferase [Microdochium trichocladiopsis]